MLPLSLLILILLGYWIYRNRRRDFWALLGVTALVARFWVYHRTYDNLLLLLSAVGLFRIVKKGPLPGGWDIAAGLLLIATWIFMVLPNRLLLSWPPWGPSLVTGQSAWPLWDPLFKGGQFVTWLGNLAFFLLWVRREKTWKKPEEDNTGTTEFSSG
jgi:hypothetical protein